MAALREALIKVIYQALCFQWKLRRESATDTKWLRAEWQLLQEDLQRRAWKTIYPDTPQSAQPWAQIPRVLKTFSDVLLVPRCLFIQCQELNQGFVHAKYLNGPGTSSAP